MTPEAQLDAMIDRFLPEVAAVAREAVARIGAMFPGVVWLVYDNYNALAIAFGPNEKARSVAGSVALYPRWTSLFLSNGPRLPDPHGLLQGEGGTMRHIRLKPGQIDDPAVIALIEAAATSIALPIDPAAKGYMVIKSIAAKQRPRRPS
jgi:hypothetical protein